MLVSARTALLLPICFAEDFLSCDDLNLVRQQQECPVAFAGGYELSVGYAAAIICVHRAEDANGDRPQHVIWHVLVSVPLYDEIEHVSFSDLIELHIYGSTTSVEQAKRELVREMDVKNTDFKHR